MTNPLFAPPPVPVRQITAPDPHTKPMVPLRPGGVHQPSVQIAAPARWHGPRRRPQVGVHGTQGMPPVRRSPLDPWVDRAVREANWPADLEAAGVDISPPLFPAWHPDACGQPVTAKTEEGSLPCTLDPGHRGRRHQVWSTTGALMAESVPVRPSPRPRAKEKEAAS